MPQMTPQVSELLEKALTLSSHERGLLIDRLVESLDDEPIENGVEEFCPAYRYSSVVIYNSPV